VDATADPADGGRTTRLGARAPRRRGGGRLLAAGRDPAVGPPADRAGVGRLRESRRRPAKARLAPPDERGARAGPTRASVARIGRRSCGDGTPRRTWVHPMHIGTRPARDPGAARIRPAACHGRSDVAPVRDTPRHHARRAANLPASAVTWSGRPYAAESGPSAITSAVGPAATTRPPARSSARSNPRGTSSR
jgi:hypothetical protein